jgi:hypothetical protein
MLCEEGSLLEEKEPLYSLGEGRVELLDRELGLFAICP